MLRSLFPLPPEEDFDKHVCHVAVESVQQELLEFQIQMVAARVA